MKFPVGGWCRVDLLVRYVHYKKLPLPVAIFSARDYGVLPIVNLARLARTI